MSFRHPPRRAVRGRERRRATTRLGAAAVALAALWGGTACDSAGDGSGDAGGGGSGGAAGSGGGGGSAPITGGVGQPCLLDADCPSGGGQTLTCISPTSDAPFGVGAPQGGYCSHSCESNADCLALDELSVCVELVPGRLGYCLTTCQPGVAEEGERLLKCGSDRAQACTPSSTGSSVGICFPRCQSDASCEAGRVCDPGGLGLCRSELPQGGGVGAPCSAETAATDCQSGICLAFRDELGNSAGTACSASCTFATSNGCGYHSNDGTQREAACLEPQQPNGGPGDVGYCFELCDFSSDCQQQGWVCRRLDGAETVLGRTGECVPEALVPELPPPGPDAGAGD